MLKDTRFLVNPTGRFEIGGPHGDAGLTGRKIIVDTYGGAAPHGGGAFSGKDPSKVDRSAAYAARYVAKNIVAAGIARQCQVQVAYAIGVARPMNVTVYTEGTGKIPDEQIAELVNAHFDLRPKGIVRMLDLLRPIYRKTAAYGHFGRDEPEFTWETHGQGRSAARRRRHQVMRVLIAAAALCVAGCATQLDARRNRRRRARCPRTRIACCRRPSSPSRSTSTMRPTARKVSVASGSELKVMLDAAALAGLQWRTPKEAAPVLSPIGERIFLSKGLDPRNLGGGGMNMFRYRAERSGKVDAACSSTAPSMRRRPRPRVRALRSHGGVSEKRMPTRRDPGVSLAVGLVARCSLVRDASIARRLPRPRTAARSRCAWARLSSSACRRIPMRATAGCCAPARPTCGSSAVRITRPQPGRPGLVGVADTTAFRFRATEVGHRHASSSRGRRRPARPPRPDRVVRYDVDDRAEPVARDRLSRARVGMKSARGTPGSSGDPARNAGFLGRAG